MSVALAEYDDIDFAYPTYRIYDNPAEGKEGARAEVPGRRRRSPSVMDFDPPASSCAWQVTAGPP